MTIIHEIVQQHAEEAAFLWLLRDAAVAAPHYDLADLADLDQRIDAHLDGLRLAGDAGWEICAKELAWNEPGEVFVAALLALEAQDESRIRSVLEIAAPDSGLARGVIAALGWLSSEAATSRIDPLLGADDPAVRCIGIRGAAAHRFDAAGQMFVNRESDPSEHVARLRAAAEIGRTDQRASSQAALHAESEELRFWAAWSDVLLGGSRGGSRLREIVTEGGRWADRALQVIGRALLREEALALQRELSANAESNRAAVRLAGVVGDPALIPWLIEQMAVDDVSRAAGESFASITGVDISYDGMDREEPDDFESGPTDLPEDEDVSMDDDDDLPWPDPLRLESWWGDHRRDFREREKYLVGRPITADGLMTALREGTQRQRGAAALELKLLDPERPLFEVRALARRQQRMLSLI